MHMPAALPVAGAPFEVRAFDASGEPVAGATLTVCDLAGRAVGTLTTAADGSVPIRLDRPGGYVIHWQAGSVEVVVPFHVLPDRSDLALAAWTVPLACVLGWLALRRLRASGT
ncbi:MAG TPA: carboxypeptidase-like regulatory domain-containing protein [Planctomycetota bacterium]|nr:carboxypeptidase-like regulatory domain-containing protein [Planctomycetota bacterium]